MILVRGEVDEDEFVELGAEHRLERWLAAVSAWMCAFEGLPDPLRTAVREQTALAPSCEEVIGATDHFLTAAQRDGHARADVRGIDLYLGTLASAWAAGADAADDSVVPGLRELLRRGWAVDAGTE